MKPARLTQSQRILGYLQEHPEGIYAYELTNDFHILQYNARIFDLRAKGWDIRNDYEGHFVLHREPRQLDFNVSFI